MSEAKTSGARPARTRPAHATSLWAEARATAKTSQLPVDSGARRRERIRPELLGRALGARAARAR
jgi:hypothetical protein